MNTQTISAIAPPNDETRWLWAAAVSAWFCAAAGQKRWEGFDAEVARFYAYRAEHNDAIDLMREALRDEGEVLFRKPAGFKDWASWSAQCFGKLGLSADVARLAVGDKVTWSVYHLTIAKTKTDELYDPRGDLPAPENLVRSIHEVRGVFEALKVVIRKKELVVADGRQRTNATREHDLEELQRYYEELDTHLRAREPQRSLLDDVGDVDDIELPVLVIGVPCIVHVLENGRLLKNLSNMPGLEESVLDQARAVWELMAEYESASKVANMRGTSTQTVYNFMNLKKLSADWMRALEGKHLSPHQTLSVRVAYKLGRETPERQKACHKAYLDAVQKNYLTAMDKFVEAWLSGKSTEKPAGLTPKEKAYRWEATVRLREELERIDDDDARRVLPVLRALEDPEKCGELPLRWRAAIEDLWDTDDQRKAWNAIGVYDPATPEQLWELMDMDALTDDATDDDQILQRASLLWQEGLSWGAAFEQGKVSVEEVGRHMEAAGVSDNIADDAEKPNSLEEALPEAPQRSFTGIVLEDLANHGPPGVASLATTALEKIDPLRVSRPEGAAPLKVQRWGGFTKAEQAAWEAAGVSHTSAKRLRAGQYSPEFLARRYTATTVPQRVVAALGEEALTTTIGKIYSMGVVGMADLDLELTREPFTHGERQAVRSEASAP